MVQSLQASNPSRIFFALPELLDSQRDSFNDFLKQGIAKEFLKLSPIRVETKHLIAELILDGENYQLISPNDNPRECILKMKTYDCKLYIKGQIVYKTKAGTVLHKTKSEWVLVGHLPLMTKRGHFIINGSPRVIVQQVVRCPGIYFQETPDKDSNKRSRFYADIIPKRGVWLRVQLTKKGEIQAKFKKGKKIQAEILQKCLQVIERQEKLRALVSNYENLAHILSHPSNWIVASIFDGVLSTNVINACTRKQICLNEICIIRKRKQAELGTENFNFSYTYDKLYRPSEDKEREQLAAKNDSDVADSAFKAQKCYTNLFSTFKIESRYDLSELGRQKINTKFGIALSETQLTALDLQVTRYWLQKYSKGEKRVDDIDHSKNRRIRTSGSLLQNQFENGIERLKKFTWTKLKEFINVQLNEAESLEATVFSSPLFTASPFFTERLERRLTKVLRINPHSVVERENGSEESKSLNISKNIKSSLISNSKVAFAGTSGPVRGFSTPAGENKDTFWASLGQKQLSRKQNVASPHFAFSKNKTTENRLKTREQNWQKGSSKLSSEFNDNTLSLPFTIYKTHSKRLTENLTSFSFGNSVESFRTARSLTPQVATLFDKNCVLPKADIFCLPAKAELLQQLDGHQKQIDRGNPNSFTGRNPFPSVVLLRKTIGLTTSTSFPVNSKLTAFKDETLEKQKLTTQTFNLYRKIQFNLRRKENISLKNIVSAKPITGAFREFFGSNPLSQYMDQTNPLAEITHKRRISSLGIGGVSRDSAGMAIRGIHATHYGRICPIETPEGKNAGLVNSLSFFAKVDSNGFIKTPYYKVFKGQVQNELGFAYFSAEQETVHNFCIAPSDLQKSCNNVLQNSSVAVRVADNLLDLFKKIHPYAVDCIGISPIQMISVATSLIPFLEHNDANRALMGSNMQRQAVPLMIPERPLVGTGLESVVLAESGHVTQAKVTGFISYVSCHEIIVESLNKFRNKNSERITNGKRGGVLLPNKSLKTFSFSDFSFGENKQSLQNKTIIKKVKNKTQADQKKILPRFLLVLKHYKKVPFRIGNVRTEHLQSGQNFVLTKPQQIKLKPTFNSFCFANNNTEKYSFIFSKNIKTFDSKAVAKTNLCTSFSFENSVQSKITTRQFLKSELASCSHVIQNFNRSNQDICLVERALVQEGEWVQQGDILTDCSASEKGELAVGKNVLLAYLPWEGYNFEDAIVISDRLVKENVYTSLHIERYDFDAQDFKEGNEWFTNDLPGIASKNVKHLNEFGLPKIGSFVKEGDILVGKIKYSNKKATTPYERLLCDILGEKNFAARDASLYLPRGVEARVIHHQLIGFFDKNSTVRSKEQFPNTTTLTAKNRLPKVVNIFLGEKRPIQVGDKMSGRHGNKGVVSTILPRQDMPYLADGTPIDVILNPLGVPSRMNVGQVFECLLGLAATYLAQHFKITPFDETYGIEASQSLVYLKLYQARLQSGQNWLFQVDFPGKTRLIDGRSGEAFDQWVTVGKAYMLKLIHMVNEKIHARSTGPYALITQQPLRGRSQKGGQRLGEMEVWALQGFGAAYTLQELLTKKSDDSIGRKEIAASILPRPVSILETVLVSETFDETLGRNPKSSFGVFSETYPIASQSSNPFYVSKEASSRESQKDYTKQNKLLLGQPEIFKVLVCELQALCLDVGLYTLTNQSFQRSFISTLY